MDFKEGTYLATLSAWQRLASSVSLHKICIEVSSVYLLHAEMLLLLYLQTSMSATAAMEAVPRPAPIHKGPSSVAVMLGTH